MFIDDDDVYTPGALRKVRNAIADHPGRILVFRMDIGGKLVWRRKQPYLREGNVGMEMVVIPNTHGKLGTFAPPLRYRSDFDFIAETVALQGQPIFLKDVIVIFNQPGNLKRPRTDKSLSRLLFRLRTFRTGDAVAELRARVRVRTRARSLAVRLRRSGD
jgi:hypothetical protein